MASCLGDDLVLRMIEGAVSPAERAEANVHLVSCADCRNLVADAARAFFSDEATTIGEGFSQQALTPFPQLSQVSRYELLAPIGAGGMGVVYAAHDPQLDRQVALKLLRPDVDAGELLLKEAQAMAKVSHPNVVAVHDAGSFEGQVFIAMELVKGKTLAQWLREAPRAPHEVLDVMRSAGEGLAAAHQAGLVHRDFKPGNVLIGSDGRVRVTDFGLARATGITGTAISGTPAYMAPEQQRGERADPRTDQFSFCVTLSEALGTARKPVWVKKVLERGLSDSPAARYPSMEALLGELTPPKRAPVAIAAALVAVALGVTLFIFTRPTEAPLLPPPPVVVVMPPAPTAEPVQAAAEPLPAPEPAPTPAPKKKAARKKPPPPAAIDDTALKPYNER